MIENVTKSVRRNQIVDDAYIEKLYKDMISLYRLDQQGGAEEVEINEQKLAPLSVILLVTIALIWVGLGAYFAWDFYRKKSDKVKDSKD